MHKNDIAGFQKFMIISWVFKIVQNHQESFKINNFFFQWKLKVHIFRILSCARRRAHDKIRKVWTFSFHWKKKLINLDKKQRFLKKMKMPMKSEKNNRFMSGREQIFACFFVHTNFCSHKRELCWSSSFTLWNDYSFKNEIEKSRL